MSQVTGHSSAHLRETTILLMISVMVSKTVTMEKMKQTFSVSVNLIIAKAIPNLNVTIIYRQVYNAILWRLPLH